MEEVPLWRLWKAAWCQLQDYGVGGAQPLRLAGGILVGGPASSLLWEASESRWNSAEDHGDSFHLLGRKLPNSHLCKESRLLHL